MDRLGTCQEHPNIPRTFAGLSWVSAKTTLGKGPHVSLTDNQLRALKPKDKSYKVADERGLYVEVTPKGGKLWRFRYRIGKIEKKLSIGTYPDINLKQARHAALEARMAVAKGGDPALEKRKQKIRAEFIAGNTFEEVAKEYIEQMMVQNGRADATVVKANYFLAQLTKAIGKRPIEQIEPFEVLAPLKRLEARGKHETAKKCRSFASRVFRFGVATTRCTSDPTSLLKGALVAPRPRHYAAILDPEELGGLLRAIDGYTGYPITKYALLIAPHVFVRPGELRHAEWNEFDLDEGVWKIPEGKMKARRAHAVPLSRQVVAYLKELGEMLGSQGYVFPSARSSSRCDRAQGQGAGDVSKELFVLLSNRVVGRVIQKDRGKLSFTYDEAWRDIRGSYPLSLSMPLAALEHRHDEISAYI